jgi:hypothetical protein
MDEAARIARAAAELSMAAGKPASYGRLFAGGADCRGLRVILLRTGVVCVYHEGRLVLDHKTAKGQTLEFHPGPWCSVLLDALHGRGRVSVPDAA